jgi:hypothetical protein
LDTLTLDKTSGKEFPIGDGKWIQKRLTDSNTKV